MQAIRAEKDADLKENYVGITDFKTDKNQYEISCGDCNKIFYADRETYEGINRAIMQGLDNPFLCQECQEEIEELAYRER